MKSFSPAYTYYKIIFPSVLTNFLLTIIGHEDLICFFSCFSCAKAENIEKAEWSAENLSAVLFSDVKKLLLCNRNGKSKLRSQVSSWMKHFWPWMWFGVFHPAMPGIPVSSSPQSGCSGPRIAWALTFGLQSKRRAWTCARLRLSRWFGKIGLTLRQNICDVRCNLPPD